MVFRTPISKRGPISGELVLKNGRIIVAGAQGLQSMPPEILLKIFEQLLPLDLLTLSRLNTFLRNFLLPRSASSLWKATLRSVNAPECPAYIPLPQWSELLFGPKICQVCGHGEEYFGSTLCVELQRRVCNDFQTQNTTNNFFNNFDNIFYENGSLLQGIIPYDFYKTSRSKDPNRSHLIIITHHVNNALQEHQARIVSGIVGAKDDMEKFISVQKCRFEEGCKGSRAVKKCIGEFRAVIKDEREKELMRRLLERGHGKEAVSYALTKWKGDEMGSINVLTDNEWIRILPILEELTGKMQLQLDKEAHDRRVKSRFENGREVYNDYLATLPGTRYQSMPCWDEVCTKKPLRTLLRSRETGTVTYPELQSSIQVFVDATSNWKKRHEERLAALLPGPFRARYTMPVTDELEGSLALAVAVFERAQTSVTCWCGFEDCWATAKCDCWHAGGPVPYFGWNNIGHHHCTYTSHHGIKQFCTSKSFPKNSIKFSERGSMAVVALAHAVGLDETRARDTDFDRKGTQFTCDNCSAEHRDGVWKKETFSWRGCVMHFMHPSMVDTRQQPMWTVLPLHEQHKGIDEEPVWGCNMCWETLYRDFTRSDAVNHVKEVHHVRCPLLERDYFIDDTRTSRLPATKLTAYKSWIPIESSKPPPDTSEPLYHCLHCRSGMRQLRSLDQTITHLNSRHRLQVWAAEDNISKTETALMLLQNRHATYVMCPGSKEQNGSVGSSNN